MDNLLILAITDSYHVTLNLSLTTNYELIQSLYLLSQFNILFLKVLSFIKITLLIAVLLGQLSVDSLYLKLEPALI